MIKLLRFFTLSLCAGLALGLAAQEPGSKVLFEFKETTQGITVKVGSLETVLYSEVFGLPEFSENYASWIVAGRKVDGTCSVTVNGAVKNAVRPYSHIERPFVNDAGTTWGFTGIEMPVNKDSSVGPAAWLVVNGKEYGPYDWVEATVYADGSWYARAETKTKDKRQAFVVANDKKYGPFEEVRDILKDLVSKEPVIIIKKGDQEFLLVKGKEYGGAQKAEPLRTMAGDFIGLVLEGKNGRELVIGDKKFGPYEWIDSAVILTKTGWLMRAGNQGKNILLADGKETAFDWLDLFPRGDSYVMISGNQNRIMVSVDGRDYGPFYNIKERYIENAGSWAFEAERQRLKNTTSIVVIDGKEYPGERLRRGPGGIGFSWLFVSDDGLGTLNSIGVK